jgi:adenylosuccinate lyase
VERIALPDAAICTDYLLHLTRRLVDGLVVDTARMRANLQASGGLVYSSAVLLDLVDSGLSREDAYAIVQAAAMQAWETGAPFRDALASRAKEAGLELDEARLDEVMRPERYLARLGPVFDRLAALH